MRKTRFARLAARLAACCLWAAVLIAAPATAQTAAADAQTQRAKDLYQQGKYVDAMPLLEQASADHPKDAGLKEAWAHSILQYAATLSDPEQRKKARIRARTIALQAKDLGDNSDVLQMMLQIPVDGSEPSYSDRKDVDEAMRAAEAEFARGDFDKAREGYLRALKLDPNNYEAALFIGDVYFKQRSYPGAGEWFANAIRINPDRETAYRYWGDALLADGKDEDARSKYIDAIIAEPYTRLTWQALSQWANKNKVVLNNIRLKDRAAVTSEDGKKININLDDPGSKKGDPNDLAWTAYALTRASWQGDKFKKEFPRESKYRQSLKEEAEALHAMASVVKEQKDFAAKEKQLDPSLADFLKVDAAGLTEPFALLNRANEGIVQDYPAYRAANRANLRRYLDEFVVPKTPIR